MVNAEIETESYCYDRFIYHNYQKALLSVEEDIKRPLSLAEETAIEKNFKDALEQHRSRRFKNILKQRTITSLPKIEGIREDSIDRNIIDYKHNITTPSAQDSTVSSLTKPISSNISAVYVESPYTTKYRASEESYSSQIQCNTPPTRMVMPPIKLKQNSSIVVEDTLINASYVTVEARVNPPPVREYPSHWYHRSVLKLKNVSLNLIALATKTSHSLRIFITKTMDPEYYGTDPLPCDCRKRHDQSSKKTRYARILEWVDNKQEKLKRRAYNESDAWELYRSELDQYHGKVLYGPRVHKKRGIKRKVPYS